MNFEAAIFDLDGTLLNSMDLWEQIDISFLESSKLYLEKTNTLCYNTNHIHIYSCTLSRLEDFKNT